MRHNEFYYTTGNGTHLHASRTCGGLRRECRRAQVARADRRVAKIMLTEQGYTPCGICGSHIVEALDDSKE